MYNFMEKRSFGCNNLSYVEGNPCILLKLKFNKGPMLMVIPGHKIHKTLISH